MIEMIEAPLYREAFSNEKSLDVAYVIASKGGVASFSDIEAQSRVKGSTLKYHLDRLIQQGVLKALARGTYGLKYKTPICYLFETNTPIAYMGLLGRRNNRTEPETEIAVKLLEEEKHKVGLKYVVTSPESLIEWKSLKLDCQWILCYGDEIIDIDAVKAKVVPQLQALLKEYVVVLDCTSATKPASIAFYEMAQEYLVPLIYIYEKTQSLKWLISKETIKRRLNISKS